jgi:hypothetical protein
MRKHVFFVFVLALVFLLSGCSRYTSEYIDELQQKWDDEYFALEEKYYEALDDAEKAMEESLSVEKEYATVSRQLDGLVKLFGSQEDSINTVYNYFSGEKKVSFEYAHDSFMEIFDSYCDFIHGNY